jgi:hypothetical protein
MVLQVATPSARRDVESSGDEKGDGKRKEKHKGMSAEEYKRMKQARKEEKRRRKEEKKRRKGQGGVKEEPAHEGEEKGAPAAEGFVREVERGAPAQEETLPQEEKKRRTSQGGREGEQSKEVFGGGPEKRAVVREGSTREAHKIVPTEHGAPLGKEHAGKSGREAADGQLAEVTDDVTGGLRRTDNEKGLLREPRAESGGNADVEQGPSGEHVAAFESSHNDKQLARTGSILGKRGRDGDPETVVSGGKPKLSIDIDALEAELGEGLTSPQEEERKRRRVLEGGGGEMPGAAIGFTGAAAVDLDELEGGQSGGLASPDEGEKKRRRLLKVRERLAREKGAAAERGATGPEGEKGERKEGLPESQVKRKEEGNRERIAERERVVKSEGRTPEEMVREGGATDGSRWGGGQKREGWDGQARSHKKEAGDRVVERRAKDTFGGGANVSGAKKETEKQDKQGELRQMDLAEGKVKKGKVQRISPTVGQGNRGPSLGREDEKESGQHDQRSAQEGWEEDVKDERTAGGAGECADGGEEKKEKKRKKHRDEKGGSKHHKKKMKSLDALPDVAGGMKQEAVARQPKEEPGGHTPKAPAQDGGLKPLKLKIKFNPKP